jgi:hypothetical protein
VVKDAGAGAQAPDRSLGRRFRRRELVQGDGTALVLNADGSIELRAVDRTVVRTWRPDDAEWGAHAFRFGIRAQEPTVPPRRPVAGSDRPGS